MAVKAESTTHDVVSTTPGPLSTSVVFDMLSNARRRYLLQYLRSASEMPVHELSRRIAARENGVDPTAVTSTQRKRVYTALHQTHLPRLEEVDVVVYDRDRGAVSATDRLACFEPYLDSPAAPDWPRYYLGLGLAALALAIGIALEAPVLGGLDAGVVALAVGLPIVAVAVVQLVSEAGGRTVPTSPGPARADRGDATAADD